LVKTQKYKWDKIISGAYWQNFKQTVGDRAVVSYDAVTSGLFWMLKHQGWKKT